ncbi:hypothetical protein LEP1GSC151_5528 [Leptospira interrogans serovar Grippotyphosa str. LT2186]|uniref:Uncharacterized protein n=1 Tax=Leptospira interrogans serovar Grippotyphosa str. LT2186 TaxID=1001599 RepID=M3HF24_LEPIR|nr:hypothetical protein [Leptospira interrogans]EMG11220.1 hypothetical protein LEP1GSC151_5528 [Leptospira interrogans serovar Grippotyphosa str. LT2186]
MCLLILKSYSICGLVMALYGSCLNSVKRFPMGRVLGREPF